MKKCGRQIDAERCAYHVGLITSVSALYDPINTEKENKNEQRKKN